LGIENRAVKIPVLANQGWRTRATEHTGGWRKFQEEQDRADEVAGMETGDGLASRKAEVLAAIFPVFAIQVL